MQVEQVDGLSEKAAKEFLKEIIEYLDELDGEDYFGTEGWRHFFGVEG